MHCRRGGIRAAMLALLFAVQILTGPALSSPPSSSGRSEGVLLVKFRALPTAAIDALNRQFGTRNLGTVRGLGIHRLGIPAGRTVEEMIAQYRALSDVEFAEPDFLAQALDTVPNDTLFGQQWAPLKVALPAAWDLQAGSLGVVVAVVDTGVDPDHPDLSGRVAIGYNAFNQTADARDDNGHGTHVAGILGAVTNNAKGIAGVTWEVTILPVKVLDAAGVGTYSLIADGITYAADHGAKVINLSLGGSAASATLEAAVNYAWDKGAVVACAAGNSGTAVIYPAAYVPCTAVGATDQNDQKASFSSMGPGLDVTAPGVAVLSTVPTATCTWCDPSGYRVLSGTSMATPHVAGLAALLFSRFPTATNQQVENQIKAYADDLGGSGWDENYGYGRINAYRALSGAFPAPTVPPAPQRPRPLAAAILSPPNGATVSGLVTIRVAMDGGTGPYRVAVSLVTRNHPKVLCDVSTTATTVECPWDARKGPPGPYSIYVSVTDASTSVTGSVTVTMVK